MAAVGRAHSALFAARSSRPRPHLDDKILTAWNGLMVAAFARAARVLVSSPSSARYLAAARKAADFIRTQLWLSGEGRLLRRYRDGEAAIDGYAEDFASLIYGLLELFQADGDAVWLEWAVSAGKAGCALSAIRRTAAGSAPPGRIRTFCCVSGKIMTVPSRPRARLRPTTSSCSAIVGGVEYLERAEQSLARYGIARRRCRRAYRC
jgi:uncharacterized protein YyaL (SSP411 family)